MFQAAHRLQSSSFLGLPYRILNKVVLFGIIPYRILDINHNKGTTLEPMGKGVEPMPQESSPAKADMSSLSQALLQPKPEKP